jgi:hypothetical protein
MISTARSTFHAGIIWDGCHGRLIVEDEPLIALEVHAAFSAAGASIVAAGCSSEAMQMINSPGLSAAVVDIDLGRGEDCSAVCKRLSEQSIPIGTERKPPPCARRRQAARHGARSPLLAKAPRRISRLGGMKRHGAERLSGDGCGLGIDRDRPQAGDEFAAAAEIAGNRELAQSGAKAP